MNDLTPVFERETGQLILEGPPAGVAGEAPLIPVHGMELAFDRADGWLCRAVVEAAAEDGSLAVGEQAAAMLIRLFGPEAPGLVPGPGPREGPPTRVLSCEPGLTATLSSLARLDAARATSPVPPDSPWWAAEAAELAERGGLRARARAEAQQAASKLLGQLDSLKTLPADAVRTAAAAARIHAVTDPQAAARLRGALKKLTGRTPDSSAPGAGFDVAAEVERLEKDRVRLGGLHWMLDPGLAPEGLFQPGLSPHSDLSVRHDSANGRLIIHALLTPGAASGAVNRCLARLVDPVVRRVLAQAAMTKAEDCGEPSRVTAGLELPFPLDEVQDGWIEVVADQHWPVRSATGYRIRRALRWADTALRAERAPAGLAPHSTPKDWAALAAAAWEHCRRDWEAAGDACHAALATQRRTALDSGPCVPPPPGDPAYLAEVLGG
jgi:hypothetical protein